MDAKFVYCGNSIEIKNFQHHIEDEMNGNPYNCTFSLKVVSGLFSGFAGDCEYDYKEWKKFIKQLDDLYLLKTDRAELVEICYGGNVLFLSDGLGHIQVSGMIYGSGMIHSLEFEFIADQTALPMFLKELKQL